MAGEFDGLVDIFKTIINHFKECWNTTAYETGMTKILHCSNKDTPESIIKKLQEEANAGWKPELIQIKGEPDQICFVTPPGMGKYPNGKISGVLLHRRHNWESLNRKGVKINIIEMLKKTYPTIDFTELEKQK